MRRGVRPSVPMSLVSMETWNFPTMEGWGSCRVGSEGNSGTGDGGSVTTACQGVCLPVATAWDRTDDCSGRNLAARVE